MTEVQLAVKLGHLYDRFIKGYRAGNSIDNIVYEINLLTKKYIKEELDRRKRRGCNLNGID